MSASDVIARLRELRAKATAGPWSVIKDKSRYWIVNKNGDAELGTFAVARDVWREANAAAIVAAMNSLPALLDAAEALEPFACRTGGFLGNITDEDVSKARAALQALAQTGENNA